MYTFLSGNECIFKLDKIYIPILKLNIYEINRKVKLKDCNIHIDILVKGSFV